MQLTVKQWRFCYKAVGHFIGFSPVFYLAWLFSSGRLGFDPGKEIIHALGFSAVVLLMATLLVTPLKMLGLNRAIWVRRLLGLWTFFWATLHIIAYCWFELGWNFGLLSTELVKRPYLWLGLVAWGLLCTLAVTSTQRMQERLRIYWRRLHQGIYLIALLAGIHYWWSLKVVNSNDLLWIALLWLVVVIRWLPIREWLGR